MGSFSVMRTIDAPAQDVWAVLAEIGEIHAWNPGVESSRLTTEQKEGVGAGRHCDLSGRNYVDEEVVEWQPGERLTMRVIGTNLPFKIAEIHFLLRAQDGSTAVTVSLEYDLKFGVAGKLLDLLLVRRIYERGMGALLSGLKREVERRARS
ncbi:MAG: SRPBCC family protein [Gemmatimonadota bacterium]